MQNIEFHGQIKDQSMQALRYEDGSHYVMKAIIQTLVNKGYTIEQAIEWVQSRNLRYSYDAGLDDAIMKAVFKFIDKQINDPKVDIPWFKQEEVGV